MENKLFYNPRKEVLLAIYNFNKPVYIYELAKKLNSTHNYCWLILNMFTSCGLIEMHKQGRKKMITLTDKGNMVATNINFINNTIKEVRK